MSVRMTLDRKPMGDTAILRFLNDDYPGDLGENYALSIFLLLREEKTLQKLWNEYKPEILPKYIKKFPGRRPSLWWDFSGPRIQVSWPGVRDLTEPRRKISGFCFLPWDNAKSLKPWYFRGVPVVSGVFDIYDINDPAYFESEPSYLKRFNLLSDIEEKQLTEKDFEPESFLDILMERKRIRPY